MPSPRASFWIRTSACAAPALFLASARTGGDEERAPCPPVASRVDDVDAFERRDAPQQWSIGDPTAEEQLLLELMNRARMHPADEGDRIFVDYGSKRVTQATNFFLAQRPGVEFTRAENRDAFHGYAAKPPLAFSSKLIAAARGHSTLLRQYDQQSHQISDGNGDPLLGPGGAPVEPDERGRVVAAGYSATFLAESVFSYADDMLHAHAGFAIDFGQPVPTGATRPYLGHRLNLMGFDGDAGRDYREVGVGVIEDENPATTVGPRIVTIDFAIPAADPTVFVTGVVYDDLNGNGFYDVGEGLGGVRVDLDVGNTYAVTSDSGGYAIPVFGAPGTVHVTATGQLGTPGGVVGTQTVAVDVTTANVKADFNRPPDPPLPPWVEFASTSPVPFDGSLQADSVLDVTQIAGAANEIGDLEVEVAIDHPAREHLDVRLFSPNSGVVLFDHGAPGSGLHGVFDSTLSPQTSSNRLYALFDLPYVGRWTLHVAADSGAEPGWVASWKLRIRPRWVRSLWAEASPLYVTKFATTGSRRPAADTLTFAAVVDGDGLPLGAPGAVVLRVLDPATYAELFATPLPATAVKRAVKGSSKTVVGATVKKLDLPEIPIPAFVKLELVIDDAIVAETVPLTARGAFNGATTKPASNLFRVNSLTTKTVKGVPTYTLKGRFATNLSALVGTGTLDIGLGAFHLRDSMSKAKTRGKLTTFAGLGGLKSLTIDPVKGAFTMVVATTADVRSGGTSVDVALRLGENGFFGATSIVPAGSASSPTY